MAAVAADLRILIAHEDRQYQEIAAAAGISPQSLSKKLSGNANLTLESIGQICDAIGKDFDIVFRNATERRSLQKWEEESHREDALQACDKALDLALRAKATMETVQLIHKKMWSAAAIKFKEQGANGNKTTTYQRITSDEPLAAAA